MKILSVLCFALSFACRLSSLAAEPLGTNNAAAQAMIQSFLKQESIRLDGKFLDGVTNRQQWEAQRGEWRRQYLEMLGLWPLPEKTPLQPVVTGVLERDEGFRVEKLHFQSRPRLYVTGNLYLPKNAAPGAKLPAVLYVCGHSGRGRDGNKTAFQQHGMWFATHGYACLLIDTLQLGEIAAIHHGTYRYDRWWWQARGYTPAGVECWNGIRAIDYLQSRPEVDPDRIGVTGISGGGAATFWITAADDRVKVSVPVSGMGDLEDYVGEKVVNGHCDCMFLINAFQWPWTQIAALVPPRPMLFENSGHDTIFPMNGNDRIRARLERLYGFYTNRTDRLFDIGVTPGGHDDRVELRLMAYRWINRFLKGEDKPVTEPELPPFEGKLLRAFPEELPADEINTKIDESFVPLAADSLPSTAAEYQSWRSAKVSELTRIVFPGLMAKISSFARSRPPGRTKPPGLELGRGLKTSVTGEMPTEPGITVRWKSYPGRGDMVWLVALGEQELLETKPDWLNNVAGGTVVLVAPRGTGGDRWSDPAPYYVRRSLALLGRTVDGGRLLDVLTVAGELLDQIPPGKRRVTIAGRGQAGVIAAYAGLMEPRLSEVMVVDPPGSHREGPIFLNVLRVIDVPDAFGLLAPRKLQVRTSQSEAFARTRRLYELGGGIVRIGDPAK